MQSQTTGAGRILVINPNSSVAVTAAIDAGLQALRIAGGPEIIVDTLRSGPPGIATQCDADSVVMPLVQWVREDSADAFVLVERVVLGFFAERARAWLADVVQ